MNAMNIHIIVGLPGSGKTTFANTLNCEVVDDPNDLNLVANKTAETISSIYLNNIISTIIKMLYY